ncbi:MAG: rhodanese-like domain-containing protein [Geminicoccaceae bacterium]|nr:rhodanese-like domain-containing protein [Geminicoccaceae bacterium]MCX8100909.1 rhodanese-like domain-containing protein [Geminicoccaceae bacterium]
MRWWQWLPFGRVPEIAPEELARRIREGRAPVILDVRTAGEVAEGTVPGARHVPVQELAARFDALNLPAGSEVVAVCKTAHRSIPAVRFLNERGMRAVQLAGGMDAWRRAGLPVERPRAA